MVKIKMEMLIALLMVLITSCFPIFYDDLLDDKLSIEKKNYIGNQLRLDVYYYNTYMNTNGKLSGTPYFFYSDGVIFELGGFTFDKQDEREVLLNDSKLIAVDKKYKTSWGLFDINEKVIKIEKWHFSSGGPLRAYTFEGVILNDTTFKITERYRLIRGNKTELRNENEIYHFKQFSAKPDSTNKWIK